MIRIGINRATRRFVIQAPYNFLQKIKAIPGRQWNKEQRYWHLPVTGAAAVAIAETFEVRPGCSVEYFQAPEDFWRLYKDRQRFLELMADKDIIPGMPAAKTKPWRHQEIGFHLLQASDALYLRWEMGTGKTKTPIDATTLQSLRRVLIACPLKVVPNWPGQWETHGDPRACKVLALDKGSIKERAERIRQVHELRADRPLAVVLNHEAAWREPMAGLLCSIQWDLVVCDEIHRIKDPKSKVSLYMAELGTHARKRLGLSGTPMPLGPLDLFGQLRFLDAALLGDNYYSFLHEFAVQGGYENKQVVSYKNLDKLNRIFYSIAHRVIKSEVLDLPPTTHVQIFVELSHKARAVYEQLQCDFMAAIEEGTVTIDNALVELLRLQQITGGAIKDDEGNFHEVDTSKQDALQELLEDLPKNEPVVIFCRFHHDLDAIKRASAAAGRICGELSGRQNDLAEWQRGGKQDPVDLATQIQAGGVGVDQTRACHVVYYSIGFNKGDYDQSLARSDRQGQKRPVTYYHLIAKETIDERVYQSVDQKEQITQSVLRDMISSIKKRVIKLAPGTEGLLQKIEQIKQEI